jgi:hypothetical protein
MKHLLPKQSSKQAAKVFNNNFKLLNGKKNRSNYQDKVEV